MTKLRHILVRDLEFLCEIGFYRREKGRTQPVRINLDLAVEDAPVDDHNLATVVDYCALIDRVRAMAKSGHVNLVETLAERIATLCLEDARVKSVRVRVDKPEAIPDAVSAGVEIERTR